MRLWQAEVLEGQAESADFSPGNVVAESAAGIDVKTGDGVLRVTQLQAEGKRKMTVADFLNANSLLGQILS